MSVHNLEVELGNFLSEFDVTDKMVEKLDKLEDYLREAQKRYVESPTEEKSVDSGYFVSDYLYDIAMSKLRELRPDSEVASNIWEVEWGNESTDNEYNELLREFPMKSIETVKGYSTPEFIRFYNLLPNHEIEFFLPFKINGWGIRVIYKNGQFVKASSRMRKQNGVDLTNVMYNYLENINMLYIEDLKDVPLVEIRGELHLPLSRLEKAREYNPKLVNPLYAVNSLRGKDMPKEAHHLLEFLAYRYLEHDLSFSSKTEEYGYLGKLGFDTPQYMIVSVEKKELSEFADFVNELVDEASAYMDDMDVFTDGLVMMVNDTNDYKQLGGDGRVDFGAIALKVGHWSQKFYTGIVQCVLWSKGKVKFTPVTLVGDAPNKVKFKVDGVIYEGFYDLSDNCPRFDEIKLNLSDYIINLDEMGIVTSEGATVRNVPCYNVASLYALDVVPNGELNFYFGGESAVVPCDSAGNVLKDLLSIDNIL